MRRDNDDVMSVGYYETDSVVTCSQCGDVTIATIVNLLVPMSREQVMHEVAVALVDSHDRNHYVRKVMVVIGPRNVGDN